MGLREHEIEMVDEIVSRVVLALRDEKTSQVRDVLSISRTFEGAPASGTAWGGGLEDAPPGALNRVELDGEDATEFEGSGTVAVASEAEHAQRLALEGAAAVPRTIREWSAAHERSRLDNAQLTDELEQAKAREVELTDALTGTGDLLKAVVAKAELVSKSAEVVANMTSLALLELFNVSGVRLPHPLLVKLRKVQQLVDELRGHL